jgi:hypothetical protein
MQVKRDRTIHCAENWVKALYFDEVPALQEQVAARTARIDQLETQQKPDAYWTAQAAARTNLT